MTEFRPDRAPLVAPGGVDLHPRDMTATFSTDVTLADAQGQLAAIDQWIPIDGDPSRTLGRLVERNSTGPLRLGYGAWRDLLLGCQFVNGRGELVTAGGRTVKNVAGYDLTKFMVGQAGAFGRPVAITTRTYRRPEGAVVARFPAGDVGRINRLLPTPCRPQWAAMTRDAMWCGYLGDDRTLAYYESALPAHGPVELSRRSLEEDAGHRGELWRAAGADDGAFRAAVPPTKVVEFADAAGLRDWTADAAFGVVVGPAPADDTVRDRIRAAARAAGGGVFFVAGGRPVGEHGPAVAALLGRLKTALDPEGRLASLD
jgi:FAD/FMN-containing dehydrogenase